MDTTPGPQSLIDTTRLALRGFAKSVVIISTRWRDRRYAIAASAVDSVSLDPPSMLACVNRSSSIWPPLSEGAGYCINILTADQEALAHHCSVIAKGDQRFDEGQWDAGEDGIPRLADAQANILCRQETSLTFGSHQIFVGRVIDVRANGTVDPLIYVDGRYSRLPS